MKENLVIVESPAKAKTIQNFLGQKFDVKSSYGHIRDLEKKDLGVDIDNNFEPRYIVPTDKKKIVNELKKDIKNTKTVWLATDEDREGEAIAWHLSQELKLNPKETKRIVFHEITKDAILNAVENPRDIDINLVNAQQARRILDRLVGFKLSPILWKKIKPSLSAGRVQSVALRLLVEREREIIDFKPSASFKVSGIFEGENENNKKTAFQADLNKRIPVKKQALEFLENCKNADFSVKNITKKPSKKNPAAPFTTSTLQQEASRKLGFSVKQTMRVAQNLYEAGKITYMRTDSVNLSNTVLKSAKEVVSKSFGAEYVKTRQYTTKIKGSQEAHEAIRPTYIDNSAIQGNNNEQRLYELIWKRTIASQMKEASIEKTTIDIDVSKTNEIFQATGEVIQFDGFLKVYIESSDDEKDDSPKGMLPPLKQGQLLEPEKIFATEKFTHHPPRYTEASLVKKLEELGIGRPSTYAPTISTIQDRGYVTKENREGEERTFNYIILQGDSIKEEKRKEITGAEKAKLFPNDIGMIVTDFLKEHFGEIMDYNFTAKVEKSFDEIVAGNVEWTKMISEFYKPFSVKVEKTLENADRNTGERVLGKDPETGKTVLVKMGRYGPFAQLVEEDEEKKSKFAGLLKGQYIETITLEEALKLFKLPRNLGTFEEKDVVVGIGRFGPYVRHDNKFASLKKDVDDPFNIGLDRAIELIKEKRERDSKKELRNFKEDKELKILNGRWGPYIKQGRDNIKLPKDVDPAKISYEKCLEIVKQQKAKKKKK